MKPNCLVIGSGKCGSTSLRRSLGEHPDVYIHPKECNFFSRDDVYGNGFPWYETHFDFEKNARVRGEGSPTYSFRNVFPEAAPRIASYVPDAKLIYIVRHPLERIESAWLQMRSWGREDTHYQFEKALHLSKNWLVDSSNYWGEIGRYRELFPDEQILVLFFEDLKSDFHSVLSRTFRFLGVAPDVRIPGESRHMNPSKAKRVPRDLLSFTRSLPLFDVARDLIPRSLRGFVRERFLMKPVDERPRWTPDAWRFVMDELGEETGVFLDFYGKPRDFWDLGDPSSH